MWMQTRRLQPFPEMTQQNTMATNYDQRSTCICIKCPYQTSTYDDPHRWPSKMACGWTRDCIKVSLEIQRYDNQTEHSRVEPAFSCRLVTEWIEVQEEFIRTISNRKPNQSGSTWLQGIITTIWCHVYQEWETWNEARHSHDTESQEIAQYEQAQRETVEIHAIQSKILPEFQDVFYDSIEDHFEVKWTHVMSFLQLLAMFRGILAKATRVFLDVSQTSWWKLI